MNIVEQLMSILGPCVLVHIPKGSKGPKTKVWQKLTQANMTPDYLAGLNHDNNIGVLLGHVSGGLCTIDADSDEFLADLLAINPRFKDALISRGRRGGNVWVRLGGEYPATCVLKMAGTDWGEWRSYAQTGGASQTVIHGIHPDTGKPYANNGKKPVEIAFAEINWPEGISAPWIPKPAPRGVEEFFVLPSGNLSITESARGIFSIIAPTHTLFWRTGCVTEVAPSDDGHQSLRPTTPEAFCSRLEGYGRTVAAWRKTDTGKSALAPVRCSQDTAKLLMATLDAEGMLSRIRTILACPIMIEENGKIVVLGQGYYPAHGGIYVHGGAVPPVVELDEARSALLNLLCDFDFPSPGDHARAVASMLSPCLKLGRLLGEADFPLDVAEAKASQSGKTYRQKGVAAIYGEYAHVINMKQGGVGSLDESISTAMLAGRPFISIDNMRGHVDSQILESALRGHGRVDVRTVRRAPVQIATHSFLWQLSSNGADMTRDLANRSIITRNRKRPTDFKFKQWKEGALVEHVRANQKYYLGCVFAVVAQWLNAGKPRTDEYGHDFREWVQSLDWICRRVMGTAAILDGHKAEQDRIGDPGLIWLREVAVKVKALAENGSELSATRIAEICATEHVLYPGGKSLDDDEKAAQYVGRLMKKLFEEAETVYSDQFSIRRETREEQDANRNIKTIHRYVFTETQT
jgi:hypothetical protein